MCHGRARAELNRHGSAYCCVCVMVAPYFATSPAQAQQEEPPRPVNRTAAVGGFLGGMVVGLAAHEGGHLLLRRRLRRRPRNQAGRVSRHSVLRHHAPSGPVSSSGVHDLVGGLLGPAGDQRVAADHAAATSATSTRRSPRASSPSTSARRRCTRSPRSRASGPPERDTRGMADRPRASTSVGSARSSSPRRCSIRGATSTRIRAGRCGSRARRRSGSVLLVLR